MMDHFQSAVSQVCAPDEYRTRLTTLLGMIQSQNPDVVVAEAGASPLEPYNGDMFMDAVRQHVRCTVLCASDPYAVLGGTQGFGSEPDFVSGVATSTVAGIEVIEKLTDSKALNLVDPASHPSLRELLVELE